MTYEDINAPCTSVLNKFISSRISYTIHLGFLLMKWKGKKSTIDDGERRPLPATSISIEGWRVISKWLILSVYVGELYEMLFLFINLLHSKLVFYIIVVINEQYTWTPQKASIQFQNMNVHKESVRDPKNVMYTDKNFDRT